MTSEIEAALYSSLSESLETVRNFASHSVVSSIDDFFPYKYDSEVRPEYSIYDGGNDMYDHGNKVSIIVLILKNISYYDYIIFLKSSLKCLKNSK